MYYCLTCERRGAAEEDAGMTSNEMAESIVARVANPNEWNVEARRIAAQLGLGVVRIAFHPTILLTCDSICAEAKKHGLTPEQVRAACR
jgi:hypothetical protein